MDQVYSPFQPLLTTGGQKCFGLSVQEFPAQKKLAGFVRSYLQVSTLKPTPYPVMPDGTQAVFISAESIQIGGAQTQAVDIQIHQAGDYFGIWFYPGVLRHFFKLNVAEITGQFVDSRFFPCRYFSQLHHRIYQQHDVRSRVDVCEQWLLRHFSPKAPDLFDMSLNLIYQSTGTIEINMLAKQIGVSRRHLNRLFQQYTGLSTKAFSQIIRIQRACKQLYEKPDNSLEIAAELGFFDQAHLLREYKRHLLLSPGLLFKRFMSDFYNKAER